MTTTRTWLVVYFGIYVFFHEQNTPKASLFTVNVKVLLICLERKLKDLNLSQCLLVKAVNTELNWR